MHGNVATAAAAWRSGGRLDQKTGAPPSLRSPVAGKLTVVHFHIVVLRFKRPGVERRRGAAGVDKDVHGAWDLGVSNLQACLQAFC